MWFHLHENFFHPHRTIKNQAEHKQSLENISKKKKLVSTLVLSICVSCLSSSLSLLVMCMLILSIPDYNSIY